MSTVLVVCTANICRSASAAHLLRHAFAGSGVALSVDSAGTHAQPGTAGCDLSLPLVGADPAAHESKRLEADLIRGAELILCASKDHRGEVSKILPNARNRTFTIRQAARLAEFLLAEDVIGAGAAKAAGAPREFLEGDHRIQVAPLPKAPERRLAWLTGELDAARGLAPAFEEPNQAATGFLGDPDDVVDPHVVGYERHGMVVDQLRDAVAMITRVLAATYDA